MNFISENETIQIGPGSGIVVERVLNSREGRPRGNDIHLCLDQREGECQGYQVTIHLPASFLSKVSKVRLQAA